MSVPVEQTSRGKSALRLHRQLTAIWATELFIDRLAAFYHSVVVMRMMISFFFSSRRRHTSLTCDWSSDVCSSDLAGFNSVGIASAGGAGLALAEWIIEGQPASDLTAVDIRRFARFNGNNQWLRDRVGEVLGLHYAMPWPNREMETARPFRRSPVYHLLRNANACFGSRMGWERANFFAPPGASAVIEYGWGKQNWLPWSAAEQRATRTDVAVFDQTSFSKYLLAGPDAERVLQWLCTADVAVRPGRTVYTGMLNDRGTYESDITVTRLSAGEFLLVSSAATTERDQDHITRRIPADARATLADVTSS